MEELKPSSTVEAALRYVELEKKRQKAIQEALCIANCQDCFIYREWREQKKSKNCCNSMKDDRIYLSFMVFIILGWVILIAALFFG